MQMFSRFRHFIVSKYRAANNTRPPRHLGLCCLTLYFDTVMLVQCRGKLLRQRRYVMLTLEVEDPCECYAVIFFFEQNKVTWCVMAYEMKAYYFIVMKLYFIKKYIPSFLFPLFWKYRTLVCILWLALWVQNYTLIFALMLWLTSRIWLHVHWWRSCSET